MIYSDSEEIGRFASDNKLDSLIDNHAQLLNENRILRREIDRLNQVFADIRERSQYDKTNHV